MITTLVLPLLAAIAGGVSSWFAESEIKERTNNYEGMETTAKRESVRAWITHVISFLVAGALGSFFWTFSTTLGLEGRAASILYFGLMVFTVGSIYLTVVDIRIQKLPTKAIHWFGGISVGAMAVARIWEGDTKTLIPMVIGAAFYFGSYGLLWFFKPGAIGDGDVRLAVVLGALLGAMGADALIVGMAAPWILASLWILGRFLFTKNRNPKIAFGPWMILGFYVATIYGPSILELIKP